MGVFRRTARFFICTTLVLLQTACKQNKSVPINPLIIPVPASQIINDGEFSLDKTTFLDYDDSLKDVALLFKEYIENSPIKLSKSKTNKTISFAIDNSISHEEAYNLKVTPKSILITSKSSKGAFYAFQSLRQLLPSNFENGTYKNNTVSIQSLEVFDVPRFAYRGMHLDVGRHFYSVDFIKKYIDLMASLKMNTFHWHLTEDQGWRIEIKKYPKLQEIAAYRKETLIGHYSDQPHQFDGKRYGGYYTQEQIKEIVAYAQVRQVTIIPEIEMPGHSQAAIAAYPELGCTGKQIEVATKWGVFEEVYCPKETTFQFLEDVIDEVIDLFPGKYIHIGGDEAPKTHWKNCSHCQKLIKQKGLKDEHGLQSYFISRMEKYINSKGKQIIGWDEILEGGLAPNATVMSWRGTDGAVQAAKEGHDVILTPISHCYFDYYQSDNENEPLAIGGFLPLEKVYSFNPIPKELNEEESKYVLGAQGNVWTEYIPDEKKVEYMAFPRIVALSEVVWSADKNKDYTDFIHRLENYQERLDLLDVNYANHIYEVKGELKNTNGALTYELTSTAKTHPIYYSTDDTKPTKLYSNPIAVNTSMNIKAVVRDGEEALGNLFEQKVNLHKGVGAEITIDKEPHPAYNAGGKVGLVNGISGNNKRYSDKEWLGFWGEDIEITIDFKEPIDISTIKTRFYNGNGQWIYAPNDVFLVFEGEIGAVEYTLKPISNRDNLLVEINSSHNLKKIKKISIRVPNYGVIPKGRQGAGQKAWTFIDEIIIE